MECQSVKKENILISLTSSDEPSTVWNLLWMECFYSWPIKVATLQT